MLPHVSPECDSDGEGEKRVKGMAVERGKASWEWRGGMRGIGQERKGEKKGKKKEGSEENKGRRRREGRKAD